MLPVVGFGRGAVVVLLCGSFLFFPLNTQLVAIAVADVDIQLAEGDFDVVLSAQGIDVAVEFVGGGEAVADVVNVDTQFVVQGAGAEVEKQHHGLWVA